MHKEMEDILVVREFPKVFRELLRMPTTRDIEFAINLESGTILVNKATYRMAPTELKELKN